MRGCSSKISALFSCYGEMQTPRQTALPSKLCAALDLSRRLRMDGTSTPISSNELYARLGTATAPVLLDVRRNDAFSTDDKLIIGAFHRVPEEVDRWRKDLPAHRPVVAYCAHGHEVSQGAA